MHRRTNTVHSVVVRTTTSSVNHEALVACRRGSCLRIDTLDRKQIGHTSFIVKVTGLFSRNLLWVHLQWGLQINFHSDLSLTAV